MPTIVRRRDETPIPVLLFGLTAVTGAPPQMAVATIAYRIQRF